MCGIIGVFDVRGTGELDLPKTALALLKGNKNRGQEGYGLSVLDDTHTITTYKFQDLSDPRIYQDIHERSQKIHGIIGHARYPTSGGESGGQDYVQPFSVKTRDKGFAFAFNGNIVNVEELAEKIEGNTTLKFPRPLLDTRVLQEMILRDVEAGKIDTKGILENINNVIDGQCNIVLMSQDGSFTLAKDRWGFRPLSYFYDEKNGIFLFSSESRALFKVGCDERDVLAVNTGEFVKYNPKSGRITKSLMDLDVPIDKKRCFFETVYFADSKTILWGEPSNNHRYRLGQALALGDREKFESADTIVIDVPSSSLYSAKGYAQTLDLTHLSTAITKNPNSQRTFISQEGTRAQKIKEKYIFNPELKKFIQGKKCIIIDDSIVRGSTLEFLIQALKDFYEPSEVHIRIPSPPIIGPCYYAINLKHPKELLARRFFQDTDHPSEAEFQELALHFGADSLRYVDTTQMIQALRVDIKDMCLGCITGKYPTPCGQERFQQQLGETLNESL